MHTLQLLIIHATCLSPVSSSLCTGPEFYCNTWESEGSVQHQTPVRTNSLLNCSPTLEPQSKPPTTTVEIYSSLMWCRMWKRTVFVETKRKIFHICRWLYTFLFCLVNFTHFWFSSTTTDRPGGLISVIAHAVRWTPSHWQVTVLTTLINFSFYAIRNLSRVVDSFDNCQVGKNTTPKERSCCSVAPGGGNQQLLASKSNTSAWKG